MIRTSISDMTDLLWPAQELLITRRAGSAWRLLSEAADARPHRRLQRSRPIARRARVCSTPPPAPCWLFAGPVPPGSSWRVHVFVAAVRCHGPDLCRQEPAD